MTTPLGWPSTCDECSTEAEVALCLGCWRYLHLDCWSDGEGCCNRCETELRHCSCESGCVRCGLSGAFVEEVA